MENNSPTEDVVPEKQVTEVEVPVEVEPEITDKAKQHRDLAILEVEGLLIRPLVCCRECSPIRVVPYTSLARLCQWTSDQKKKSE